MEKKLIEYIGDMEHVNYADVSDFLKDIKDNSPERQVQILVNVLLNVEHQEHLQGARELEEITPSSNSKVEQLCSQEESINVLNIDVKTIDLEMQTLETCGDFILYYATDKSIGFEAQFDNGKFNGVVTFCETIGEDFEDWKPVTDKEIYEFVKQKAIKDYKLTA
jgi:hypothetical protein